MNAAVPAYTHHLLSGNEAVARAAWESGVRVAAAYPGTPATEILEYIARYPDIYSEWSVNEKVAVEVAQGACFAGARVLAAMKHVGVNVAACGPIGFIGLLAPHICRKMVGTDHRRLSIAALLFGGAFLVICDTAARTLWSPAEVPVGILTSFIGSVFFLFLLIKAKR